MEDRGCSSRQHHAKRTKHLSPAEKMDSGILDLFCQQNSVHLLKILNCNGDKAVSFSQVTCSTKSYIETFGFSSFFQKTLKKATKYLTEDDTDMAKVDSDLFQNLLKVLENSPDIAQSLQNEIDNTQKTAYTVQLSHHLLAPLSLQKEYMIDKRSKDQTYTCPCCDEQTNANFGDTSMGHCQLWHGSTDILIGKENKVPVAVHVEEEEEEEGEEEQPNMDKEEFFEQCKHQSIAETVVFGLLQSKMNNCDMDLLIPLIVISKTHVKIYFYDPHYDFLLESTSMPLFRTDGDLQHHTVVALWLAINYHVTCTGLTEAVVKTCFTADFMNNLSEDVREQYKKDIRFNYRKKPKLKVSNYHKFLGGFSKPMKRSHQQHWFTGEDYELILTKYRKMIDEEKLE